MWFENLVSLQRCETQTVRDVILVLFLMELLCQGMEEHRNERQAPTQSVTLTYYTTQGQEAINLYNESRRIVQECLKAAFERYFISR